MRCTVDAEVAGSSPAGLVVMIMYYDMDGLPIEGSDLEKIEIWSNLLKNNNIAKTSIGNLIVSTVYLGIGHSILVYKPPIEHKPLIFESAIIDKYDDTRVVTRYSSITDALLGHTNIVNRIKKGIYV